MTEIVIAHGKRLPISASKLQPVALLIRNKKAHEALTTLSFCRKKAARCLSKVLYSAIANAQNNHSLEVDRLFLHKVLIGKSTTLKRFRARARGRAGKILKRYSNVTIKLQEEI